MTLPTSWSLDNKKEAHSFQWATMRWLFSSFIDHIVFAGHEER